MTDTGENIGGRVARAAAHRVLRWAGGLLSGAMLLVILIAAGVYIRLVQGPIDLAQLTRDIEREASQLMPGGKIAIDGARIELNQEDHAAQVALSGVRIYDDDGRTIAAAPKAEAQFSLSDLLVGKINPLDLALEGVVARVERSKTGAFSFGFGGGEQEASGGGDVTSFLDGDASDRRRVSFRDATIVYLDRISGRVWRAEHVDVRFRGGPNGMSAETSAVLKGGAFGDMSLEVSGLRAPSGALQVYAAIDRAAPADIAAQIPALDWLAAFEAPVKGEMNIGVAPDGQLTALNGRLTADEGRITLNEGVVEPLVGADLAFTFDPAASRFIVDQANLESPRASANGTGFVEVSRDETGEVSDIVAQLDLSDIVIAAPEALDAPVSYDEGRVTGRMTVEPFSVELGELRLAKGPLAINAAGRITAPEGELNADLAMSGGGLTVDGLMAHWPRQAAPGAREWMLANMGEADITDFDAEIRIGGGEEDVRFDFSFQDAVGHYLRPMPPITGAKGAGQVTLKRFALSVEEGVATPPGGEPLDIAGSSFVIEDLDHPATPADIDLYVQGDLSDALLMADQEPLGFISKLGLPLEEATGEVALKVEVLLPLLKALLLEDVEAAATADISNLSTPVPALDQPVTAEAVRLVASTEAFSLKGNIQAMGARASLDWSEQFSPSSRDVTLKGPITAALLAKFGVDAPWFEDGSGAATAKLDFTDAGAKIGVNVDFQDAALTAPEFGWTKPRGDSAALKADIDVTASAIKVDDIDFASENFIASGSLSLTPEGDFLGADFPRVQYRGGLDAAVAVIPKPDKGRMNVRVRGRRLDLTAFGDLMETAGEGGEDSPPLRINYQLDQLRLRPKIVVEGAGGSINLRPGRQPTGSLSGMIGGEGPLEIVLRETEKGARATLKSDNAGALLREAGFFDDGSGGALRVRAFLRDDGELTFSGDVSVEDIVIHEDAKLEKLLLGAERDDLRAKMRQDGIVFSRITSPFRYENGAFTIDEAVAVGPFIGLNVSGDYALEQDTLDLDGVFTPFYGLNSVLGNIPLLGDLLTGGDGQGLFAFNFAVTGGAEDPDISINPLSVLTPGALRNIFRLDGDSQSSEIELKQPQKVDR
ncbi:MAG: AsmA-like C-terminal region-containing protein [Pseudomonadota bacterium]